MHAKIIIIYKWHISKKKFNFDLELFKRFLGFKPLNTKTYSIPSFGKDGL